MNPGQIFLQDFGTEHGAIPFSHITNADYEPAINKGIEIHNAEIDVIVNNPEEATFSNTIEALQHCGEVLERVLGVFFNQLHADADNELQEISQRISPILSEHSSNISMNEKLWQRVKHVHDSADKQNLTTEQQILLQNEYDGFVRSGANLEGDDRKRFKELTAHLSQLTLTFQQNVLKELNTKELWLTEDQLDGLPESAIDAAKEAAKEHGREGEYLITLHAPSYMPFLKYSTHRELREKLYMMRNTSNTEGEYSNIELIKQIVEARREKAALLGYDNFADYRLAKTMAQNKENVYALLDNLRDAYTEPMKRELKELSDFAKSQEGADFELKPWDYSYFYTKVKDSKFSINDELLRPYFELDKVIKGIFGLATRLYGITFEPNTKADVYNPEVKVFDVCDDKGKFIGMLYADFFPRATKASGAWMNGFNEQHLDADGNDVRPLVTITTNFTKPTNSKPSLLTYGEVQTFLHEFGHALHGLLTECRYSSLSGTNVYHDFVELPSQFNENFLPHKEFLDSFASHYLTGEKIPQEYIDKIVASQQFGAAYACIRQLNFGYLDMAWHTVKHKVDDVAQFEYDAIKCVEIFPPVEGCLISPMFTHIFSGGYAAGYYGYKWAEVLDADAFSKFLKDGIFNEETAHSFRDNILKRGGTEMPMVLYKRFRGQEPTVEALLKRDGIQ